MRPKPPPDHMLPTMEDCNQSRTVKMATDRDSNPGLMDHPAEEAAERNMGRTAPDADDNLRYKD